MAARAKPKGLGPLVMPQWYVHACPSCKAGAGVACHSMRPGDLVSGSPRVLYFPHDSRPSGHPFSNPNRTG